jgi:hypothetical protein
MVPLLHCLSGWQTGGVLPIGAASEPYGPLPHEKILARDEPSFLYPNSLTRLLVLSLQLINRASGCSVTSTQSLGLKEKWFSHPSKGKTGACSVT